MADSSDKGHWRIVAAAASVSAILAILATLLGLSTLRQKELRRAANLEALRAQEAALEAREAAHRGLRARDQAEELVGFLLDDLRQELVQLNRSDLLGAAAERAVAYFDQLPHELITQESQSQLASVLLTLSDARYQQGNERGAIAAATRSVEIWKGLAAAGDPDGQFTVRLGRALGELGLYQNQSNDPYAAGESYRAILRLYENPPAGLKNDGWRDHGLAKAHLGLGEIERLRENYPEARAEYAAALGHIAAALTHHSNQVSWLQMAMTLHNDTGVAFMQEKNYAAAEEAFGRAVEPNRALLRLEPQNRRWEKELATALLNRGSLLHLQKEDARAEPLLREALDLRQGVVNWDPTSARALRKLAHAWYRLAVFQFDTGQSAGALDSARHSLHTLRRLLGFDPDDREAIEEIRQYTRKYCDRLVAAGMTGEARNLIQETALFAAANRGGSSTAPGWDKLQSSLRAAQESLDGNPAPD